MSTPSNPFPDPAVWKSILPCEWQIAIPASLMRVENCHMRVGHGSSLWAVPGYIYSTRIKDAGIAIRHSRGYTFFYTAGSGNGLEGVVGDGTLVNGLKTHLKKNMFHPSSQAPGPGPGPAKKDEKS